MRVSYLIKSHPQSGSLTLCHDTVHHLQRRSIKNQSLMRSVFDYHILIMLLWPSILPSPPSSRLFSTAFWCFYTWNMNFPSFHHQCCKTAHHKRLGRPPLALTIRSPFPHVCPPQLSCYSASFLGLRWDFRNPLFLRFQKPLVLDLTHLGSSTSSASPSFAAGSHRTHENCSVKYPTDECRFCTSRTSRPTSQAQLSEALSVKSLSLWNIKLLGIIIPNLSMEMPIVDYENMTI